MDTVNVDVFLSITKWTQARMVSEGSQCFGQQRFVEPVYLDPLKDDNLSLDLD